MKSLNKNKKIQKIKEKVQGKENNKKDGKTPQAPKGTDGRQFWVNLLTTFVIFFLIISTYSIITEQKNKEIEIPISQLAVDITSGVVSSIVVMGDELEIIYSDGTEKKSKKEAGTALTDTFSNYDVPTEALSSVMIDIKGPSGFSFGS